jgi:hypothetical protein
VLFRIAFSIASTDGSLPRLFVLLRSRLLPSCLPNRDAITDMAIVRKKGIDAAIMTKAASQHAHIRRSAEVSGNN